MRVRRGDIERIRETKTDGQTEGKGRKRARSEQRGQRRGIAVGETAREDKRGREVATKGRRLDHRREDHPKNYRPESS